MTKPRILVSQGNTGSNCPFFLEREVNDRGLCRCLDVSVLLWRTWTLKPERPGWDCLLPPAVQPWTSYSIPLSLSCLISEKRAIVVSISKGYWEDFERRCKILSKIVYKSFATVSTGDVDSSPASGQGQIHLHHNQGRLQRMSQGMQSDGLATKSCSASCVLASRVWDPPLHTQHLLLIYSQRVTCQSLEQRFLNWTPLSPQETFGNVWRCFLSIAVELGLLLVPDVWGPGVLLSILQCIGQPHTHSKECSGPSCQLCWSWKTLREKP